MMTTSLRTRQTTASAQESKEAGKVKVVIWVDDLITTASNNESREIEKQTFFQI